MALPLIGALVGAAGSAAAGGLGLGLGIGKNNRRASSFYDPDGSKGTGYDANASNYGGYAGGRRDYNANINSRRNDVENRGAFQADYAQANADRMRGQQARTGAMSMADMMAARARGEVPSVAQMQADRQMGQAVAAQNAQAASARGGAATALAQQNAANNVANAQSAISNNAQINAAQERERAEANAVGAYQGIRQGDQSSEGLAGQRSQFNTQMQQHNRDANDSRAMGYEQLEARANESELNAKMQQQGILAQSHGQADTTNQQTAQANANNQKGFFEKIFSDANAKLPLPILSDMAGKIPGVGLGGPGPMSGPAQASFDKLNSDGSMDVGGSLKAHSNFATQFQSDPTGGMGGGGLLGMFSDEKAKDVVPLADRPDGGRLQIGLDGRAFYADGGTDDSRPSLSGPTPRYGSRTGKSEPMMSIDKGYSGERSSGPVPKSSSDERDGGKGPAVRPNAPKKGKKTAAELRHDAERLMESMRSDHEMRMAQGPAVKRGPSTQDMLDDRQQQFAGRVAAPDTMAPEDFDAALARQVEQDRADIEIDRHLEGQRAEDDRRARDPAVGLGRAPKGYARKRAGQTSADNTVSSKYDGMAPGTEDWERTQPKAEASQPWWMTPVDTDLLGFKSDARAKRQAFHEGAAYATKQITGEDMQPWDEGAEGDGDDEEEGDDPYKDFVAPTGPNPLPPPPNRRDPVAFERRRPAPMSPLDEFRARVKADLREKNRAGTGPVVLDASRFRRKREPIAFEREQPDELADAARSMQGSAYAYKPGLTPPSQKPGEPNFGPMAQNMEQSPIAATAVKMDPTTGLRVIDRDKALKVTMSVAADQQQQLDRMKATMNRLQAAPRRKR